MKIQFNKKQSGFTLLELIIVVAILAIIAGALLVAYDGLEKKAQQSQAAFNIGAVDRAVRTYKVLKQEFPSRLDNLVDNSGTMLGLTGLIPTQLFNRLIATTLSLNDTNALQQVGILEVSGYTGTLPTVGNQLFNPSDVNCVPTAVTPIPVSTLNTSLAAVQQEFQVAAADVVFAFGLGDRSTMVAKDGAIGSLPAAPFSTEGRTQDYNRYILLFKTVDAVRGPLTHAEFVGVADSLGNGLATDVNRARDAFNKN